MATTATFSLDQAPFHDFVNLSGPPVSKSRKKGTMRINDSSTRKPKPTPIPVSGRDAVHVGGSNRQEDPQSEPLSPLVCDPWASSGTPVVYQRDVEDGPMCSDQDPALSQSYQASLAHDETIIDFADDVRRAGSVVLDDGQRVAKAHPWADASSHVSESPEPSGPSREDGSPDDPINLEDGNKVLGLEDYLPTVQELLEELSSSSVHASQQLPDLNGSRSVTAAADERERSINKHNVPSPARHLSESRNESSTPHLNRGDDDYCDRDANLKQFATPKFPEEEQDLLLEAKDTAIYGPDGSPFSGSHTDDKAVRDVLSRGAKRARTASEQSKSSRRKRRWQASDADLSDGTQLPDCDDTPPPPHPSTAVSSGWHSGAVARSRRRVAPRRLLSSMSPKNIVAPEGADAAAVLVAVPKPAGYDDSVMVMGHICDRHNGTLFISANILIVPGVTSQNSINAAVAAAASVPDLDTFEIYRRECPQVVRNLVLITAVQKGTQSAVPASHENSVGEESFGDSGSESEHSIKVVQHKPGRRQRRPHLRWTPEEDEVLRKWSGKERDFEEVCRKIGDRHSPAATRTRWYHKHRKSQRKSAVRD